MHKVLIPETFTADYCDKWKEDRRFFMSALRGLGFGTASSETMIQQESESLVEQFLLRGAPEKGGMNPMDPVTKATTNIICNILYNKRYSIDEPELDYLIKLNRNIPDIDWNIIFLLDLFPIWFTKIAMASSHRDIRERGEEVRRFNESKIQEHIDTYIPGEQRDFIDCYIDNRGLENLNMHVLSGTLLMFSVDATETLACGVVFALLLIISNDNVQRKIQKEIDNVIGNSRKPTLADKANLPYLEATIHEALRMIAPIPVMPAHTVREDVTLQGYTIPRNANILANLHAVHHDPKSFPEPDVFRPERFLDPDGHLVKDDHIIPFGMGKFTLLITLI